MVTKVSEEKEEEEVNSYERADPALPERTGEEVNMHSKFMTRTSAAMIRVGSPCMSVSEARSVGSRRSALGHGTEDSRLRSNDVVGSNFSGCGISYFGQEHQNTVIFIPIVMVLSSLSYPRRGQK